MAAADNADRRLPQQIRIAAHKQYGRRGQPFVQAHGKIVITRQKQPAIGLLFPVESGFAGRFGFVGIVPRSGRLFAIPPQLRHQSRRGLQCRLRTATILDKLCKTFRPDIWRESQLHPRKAFCFRHLSTPLSTIIVITRPFLITYLPIFSSILKY